VILKEPLGAHHGFTIVPADEGFKLDTAAVFRGPAQTILLHRGSVNGLCRTSNLQVGNLGNLRSTGPQIIFAISRRGHRAGGRQDMAEAERIRTFDTVACISRQRRNALSRSATSPKGDGAL
jgi:hypothetical protein